MALERIESASRAANVDLRRMLEALREATGRSRLLPEPGSTGWARWPRRPARAGPHVQLTVDPAALRIADPALDHAAYRIVQEALTNVVRHAGPVAVAVDVGVAGDRLQLAVVNGPGSGQGRRRTDARWWARARGDARSEQRSSAARWQLDPTPDGGFAVRATLPIGSSAGRPIGEGRTA